MASNQKRNSITFNKEECEKIELNLRKLDLEVDKIRKALKKIKDFHDINITKLSEPEPSKDENFTKVLPEEYSSGHLNGGTTTSIKIDIPPVMKVRQGARQSSIKRTN